MATIQMRPVPKPRRKIPNVISSNPGPSLVENSSQKPVPPPKPPGLLFVGVKFRKTPEPQNAQSIESKSEQVFQLLKD